MSAGGVRVTHEWARLREVIVGRPFYRIPKPFPEDRPEGVSEALWRKVKAREGRTLEEAMCTDYRRCAGQMDAVAALLEARGVRVHRVPPFAPGEEDYLARSHPEALLFFPRDPLLAVGGCIVELCTRDGRRRRERAPLRRLLRDARGLQDEAVLSMPFPVPPESEADPWPYLEGGDCLVNGDEVLVGVGSRSNPEGIDWLRRALGGSHRVTAVPLSPDFAHLDLGLGLVRPGLGIVCREALPDGLPASLRDWEWIDVSRDEALVFMATNGMPVDPESMLLPEAAQRVADALAARGIEVIPVPFDTVTAFRGGLRCWSHPLERWG